MVYYSSRVRNKIKDIKMFAGFPRYVQMGVIVLLFFILYILFALTSSKISSRSSVSISPTKLSLLKKWQSSDWDWLSSNVTVMDPYELKNFNQKDARLINYIKARYLTPPSKLPYNFNGPRTPVPGGDANTAAQIKKVFGNQRGGFYVECGGYDGKYSETLFLERDLGWSGLLIECNPILIPELRKVHRKAFVADVCLSIVDHAQMSEITSMDNWPASSSTAKGSGIFPNHIPSNFTQFEVMSIPFYSLIAATGVSQVDVIVLDVQGVEPKILKNFPFGLIHVKMWVVEVNLLNADEQTELRNLMTRNGYTFIRGGADDFFIHKTISSIS